MKTSLLTLLSTIALTPSAFALTVDQAISTASENSHELKQLQLESESRVWGERKAFAAFLPQLSLDGRHLFSEKFEVLPIDFGGQHIEMPALQPYSSLSLNASIDLFSGFQNGRDMKAAVLAQDASEHKVSRAQEQLKTNIRSLFYRALGSQILVDVAEQNIKTLEGHLGDVGSRIRSGVSTRFDSLRVEVQLEDARTEKVAADDNVAIARARLFEALAIADDGKPLDGKLPDDFSRYENVKVSLENVKREDRAAQALIADASRQHSFAAQSHWYPRISLFGAQTWYNADNHTILGDDEKFRTAASFGLAMRWNLFDGGASLATQKQAAIAEQIEREKLAQFDQNLPLEIEESQRRLSYDLVNFKTKAGSVRKAEEAVRLARGGLRAGTRTNTEVLDAVVDLNRAKAASVKSQIDAIEDLGRLELALGRTL